MGYAPGLSSPKRPVSVQAQNLGGIPSILIQVLFSLPNCLLQGHLGFYEVPESRN